MIFQSGKYCDIIAHTDNDGVTVFKVRILDRGQDTHLDIWATDLPHALELWTAIERSPEVKLVVNVNDYIVKEELTKESIARSHHELCPLSTCTCPTCESVNLAEEAYRAAHSYPYEDDDGRDEFADCRHRPIKDSNPGEFDLERME